MTDEPEDAGYTLVELLVYIAVLALVTGMVASFAVVASTANTRVQSASTSSNSAQVAADAVSSAARGALAIAAPTANRQSLVLDSGASTGRCRAFLVSAVAGKLVGRPDLARVNVLRYRTASTAPGLPTDSASSLDRGWGILAVGVSQLTTSGAVQSSSTTGAGLLPFFSAASRDVTLAFSVDTAPGAAAQAISATYTSRQPTMGTSTPCL